MRCQSAPVLSWHAPCRRSPSTACTKSRAQDFWCSGYREHSLEHTSPSSQLPAMKIWSFVQVWMCVPGSLSCCPAAARTGVPSQLCSGPLDSTTQTSIPRACGNTHAVLNAARTSESGGHQLTTAVLLFLVFIVFVPRFPPGRSLSPLQYFL